MPKEKLVMYANIGQEFRMHKCSICGFVPVNRRFAEHHLRLVHGIDAKVTPVRKESAKDVGVQCGVCKKFHKTQKKADMCYRSHT